MGKPMTAADHFLAGEKLLDTSHEMPHATQVARAQAHFTAARLLLDAHTPSDAARETGLWHLTYQRHAV